MNTGTIAMPTSVAPIAVSRATDRLWRSVMSFLMYGLWMSFTHTAEMAVISVSTVDINAAIIAASINPKMPGWLISCVAA